MPRCGATLNENSVPHWTRGDFRGVLGVARHLAIEEPTPALRATPPTEGIFKGVARRMPRATLLPCYWCEARDSGSQTLLEFRSCIQHAFGREADVIRTNRKERAFGPGVLFLFVARITGLGALAIVDSRISRGRWIVTIPDTVVSFFLEA